MAAQPRRGSHRHRHSQTQAPVRWSIAAAQMPPFGALSISLCPFRSVHSALCLFRALSFGSPSFGPRSFVCYRGIFFGHYSPSEQNGTTMDIGSPADFHVHLRDGKLMELCAPTVEQGGVDTAYIMPNLVPPVIDVQRALAYKAELQELAPRTNFLMTLYLCKEVTPDVIVAAKQAGVAGVKVYPAGVTTNSDKGVSSYEPFYPTFAEMERQDMVLNLHGECPSGHDIHVLNAEHKFLPTLKELHSKFPKLRIVLEHCTSAAAVQAVKECGPTVAATITAHHLFLTVDSWAGNAVNFCKPVAKFPSDRTALIEAATSGNAKFFFGSDSAPHVIANKTKSKGAAAGVYTQSHAIAYVAEVFDKVGQLDKLKGFVSGFGRDFYKVPEGRRARLVEKANHVPATIGEGELSVIPFMAGEVLKYQVEWV